MRMAGGFDDSLLSRATDLAIMQLLKPGEDATLTNSLVLAFGPVLMRMVLFDLMPALKRRVGRLLDWQAMRTLEFSIDDGSSPIRPGSSRNDLLQKAVTMYVQSLKIPLTKAQTHFMAIDDYIERKARDQYMEDMGMMRRGMRPKGSDQAAQLQRLSIVNMPINGEWVLLENGIKLRITEHVEKQGEEPPQLDSRPGRGGKPQRRSSSLLYEFTGSSLVLIDEFLAKCVAWYTERLQQEEDTTRYLLVPNTMPPSSRGGDHDGHEPFAPVGHQRAARGITFKRYELSDNKNFSNLFFQSKRQLLELVDAFRTKTKKFGVQGYPHKLGLLLHGEPGTGKTSLIKALASYTKRHIVSIDLAKIETNEQLWNLVFTRSHAVEGLDFPMTLAFSNILYVFEDVDAATRIVLQRSDETDASESNAAAAQLQAQADAAAAKEDLEIETEAESEAKSKLAISSMLLRKKKSEEESKKEFEKRSDRLNLSGLLNVLDGIVECPGRLIVMTTNRPDKLDDALIRPGRIDKRIYLGKMHGNEAAEMLELYFQKPCTGPQIARLHSLLGVSDPGGLSPKSPRTPSQRHGLGRTPAELEQLCSEHDDVDSLLDALELSLQVI